MARTISQYFNHLGAKGEQRLVEDLIIESIRLNGMKVNYIPRTQVNLNPILGEDQANQFDKQFPIEMYFDNPSAGFGGNGFLIGKFGLEMQKEASFVVSRRRFNEAAKRDGYNAMPNTQYTVAEVRPMEGHLIYLPVTNEHYQITQVEHESVFYQLGYRFIWRVDVRKYDYNAENFSTGVAEIDQIQVNFDNVDSVMNDPLAENNELKTDAIPVINTTKTNIFGDPI